MTRRVVLEVTELLLLMALWLLFVVSTELPELALGAGSAVFTALLAAVVRSQCGAHSPPRLGWVLGAAHLFVRLFLDTWKVFGALFRQLFRGEPVRGAFRAVPYAGEFATTGLASAGDAFVITANSLTPNSIVLDIDRGEGLVIMHQLVPESNEAARSQLVRAAWR